MRQTTLLGSGVSLPVPPGFGITLGAGGVPAFVITLAGQPITLGGQPLTIGVR